MSKPSAPSFQYTNSLDRAYDNVSAVVRAVSFDISRYSEHSHTIQFDAPVTEQAAIAAAEEYLSQQLTEDYFEQVRNDLFGEDNWKQTREVLRNRLIRGALLRDAKFLESAKLDADGTLTLRTGS